MSRKTIPVADVLAAANHFFAHSSDDQIEERRGTAGLLEMVLHATDNYNGYSYCGAAEALAPGSDNEAFLAWADVQHEAVRRQYH